MSVRKTMSLQTKKRKNARSPASSSSLRYWRSKVGLRPCLLENTWRLSYAHNVSVVAALEHKILEFLYQVSILIFIYIYICFVLFCLFVFTFEMSALRLPQQAQPSLIRVHVHTCTRPDMTSIIPQANSVRLYEMGEGVNMIRVRAKLNDESTELYDLAPAVVTWVRDATPPELKWRWTPEEVGVMMKYSFYFCFTLLPSAIFVAIIVCASSCTRIVHIGLFHRVLFFDQIR